MAINVVNRLDETAPDNKLDYLCEGMRRALDRKDYRELARLARLAIDLDRAEMLTARVDNALRYRPI